ncbi:MAG TPA: homoserine O-acetyltransferase [Candidatus Ozemobacteraceae bacterium]|nr:homoserine O-acetyltransferase [Candidatus Ozemobacteraceae bacterium]
MIVEKKRFDIPRFPFECNGETIPVAFGYETYGTLNAARDNVVLVCHYFTGQSHAAGKYKPEDAVAGWWDELIGPGKVIDTDQLFVICCDTFCNINANNPAVITTGPATIDPNTGKPYGMRFPITTLKDMVRSQKMLLDHLGITHLRLIIGPSMGGLQAFLWGKLYPDFMEKIVAVVSTPMVRPWTLMVPNQLGIDAIRLDPRWQNGEYYGGQPPHDGLLLAFKILLISTRTDSWADRNFGRNLADPTGQSIPHPRHSMAGKYLVETEIEKIVLGRMQFFDANSYLYIAKANALYDLRDEGETFEQAMQKIKARTLMIIDDSDLLFTRDQAELARAHLPDAQCVYYNSLNGHLSCLFDIHLFKEELQSFVS